MSWEVQIKTASDEHPLYFRDEGSAREAFEQAKGVTGKNGVVTIADQLVVQAGSLVSVRLIEHT